MVALEPRGRISDQREAGGVAFWKTVLAETANLLEDPFGEFRRDSLRLHARDEPFVMTLHAPGAVPCGHVAPQLIRLARRIVRGDHRKPHHLLLKERHA